MTQALHTDLYQLTMLASYFHRGMHQTPAACELFVRRLPKNRRFLVVAGLEPALRYLESLRFTDADIEAMRQVPGLKKAMSHEFVEYLRRFRFTGTVHAMPEGTIAFQNEPFLRVEAPLGQAQLVETYLLSLLNYQTMIASKAARVVLAAKGRPVLEFGSRRTHPHAAVHVARAAYIGGFAGTSNVEAFATYDVPARGTMAHMYIMASNSEREAYAAYDSLYKGSTYLVDTYNTLRGTELAIAVVGEGVHAVRLDSGDLVDESNQVRALLDKLGRKDVKIVASSDLDEYAIADLVERGSIDSAGVGTRLATSDDAPSLGGVYKLVQIGDRPVAKLSQNKATYPGPHQVYRFYKDGIVDYDVLGLAEEKSYGFLPAQGLLDIVMQDGKALYSESIHDARARTAESLLTLGPDLLRIERTDAHESVYEVRTSEQLDKLLEKCKKESQAQ